MPDCDSFFLSDHLEKLHDVQFDYFGRKLATCSSDKTIVIREYIADNKININESYEEANISSEHNRFFDLNKFQHTATLRGHTGPVWELSWCHPLHGIPLLASCSEDGDVKIWAQKRNLLTFDFKNGESNENTHFDWFCAWTIENGSAVTCVKWAPFYTEFSKPDELYLAFSLASGVAKLYKFLVNDKFNDLSLSIINTSSIDCSTSSCNAVDWSPLGLHIAIASSNGVMIYYELGNSTVNLNPHYRMLDNYWIQDIAYSPCKISPPMIGACGMDHDIGMVWILYFDSINDEWKCNDIKIPNKIIWRLSWSEMGHVLVVSTTSLDDDEDEQVFVLKRPVDLSDDWIVVNIDDLYDEHVE
jgi:protein transport protein SEC13